jgi:branched-subunit amino acid aminotransferase/4-amino-4-deoxychorismate lyase
MGLTVAERSLELDELKSADAVFLTSSSRFIQPVARIDATTYDYDLRSKIEVSSSLGELLGLYTASV